MSDQEDVCKVLAAKLFADTIASILQHGSLLTVVYESHRRAFLAGQASVIAAKEKEDVKKVG